VTTRPLLSVVIPTYQRRDSLLRLLASLRTQTLPADEYEVIAAVDGSTDGTTEGVRGFAAPYALSVVEGPNRGRAGACNAGIRAAVGAVVVLLDDDMEAAPGFLAAHWRMHPEGSRLGVMGAVPIGLDQASSPVMGYIGRKFNGHLEKLAQPDCRLGLRDFYSGNFSIRREVLLSVGLFDEAFKLYGNEDLDLSLRLVKAGVKLVYSPEALAYQHYSKDFAALARDNIAKGRTAVLLASKYPETFRDLKLSTYRQGSFRWRWLRAGLLRLSRLWAGTPTGVIVFMRWLERRRPTRLDRYYALALDYCYWLGALSALREQHGADGRLASLASQIEL